MTAASSSTVVKSGVTNPEPINPEPINPEPAKPEPTKPAQNSRSADSMSPSLWLDAQFGLLACLGGILLGGTPETEGLPVIAISAAVIGFVFVDWLRLFALPPVIAYLAMGIAAVYSVSSFTDFSTPGAQQMTAVAELLVIVQAILILQQKSMRIYEQLSVFCLLDLVVAAVFNNALSYGLLLIPICLIGAWALSLLAVLLSVDIEDQGGGGTSSINSFQASDDPSQRSLLNQRSLLDQRSSLSGRVHATAESSRDRKSAMRRIGGMVLLTVGPAVGLIAATFFYAIPRTNAASRGPANMGQALVGFSESVQLGQIGQMMQSDELVLRVELTDLNLGRQYSAFNGLYLRGRVLEQYTAAPGSSAPATWESKPSDAEIRTRLPQQFVRQPTEEQSGDYDQIRVSVSCESMQTNTLFSIAPYFQSLNKQELTHRPDRWALVRRSDVTPNLGGAFPRMTYEFGTHAFHNGVQSDLIARPSPYRPNATAGSGFNDWLRRGVQAFGESYRRSRRSSDPRVSAEGKYMREILQYPESTIPSAKIIADMVTSEQNVGDPSDYSIAKRLEQYLSTAPEFSYTLKLDGVDDPLMDPIEQFLSIDRRGNCQYFASALAMMLRSQGIPSRLIVGYRTNEFNDLNGSYLARQAHAHAWVEALIRKEELPKGFTVSGQPDAPQYWVRLDPTPGGNAPYESGAIDNTLDLVQDLWDEFVVDMDSSHQQDMIGDGDTPAPVASTFSDAVTAIRATVENLRSGRLGGGTLAASDFATWPTAFFGIAFVAVLYLLMKVRLPRLRLGLNWLPSRLKSEDKLPRTRTRPAIAFYREMLDQLDRIGFTPAPSQTPREVAEGAIRHGTLQFGCRDDGVDEVGDSFDQTLETLTNHFYRQRYRGWTNAETDERDASTAHETQAGSEIRAGLEQLRRTIDLMISSRQSGR